MTGSQPYKEITAVNVFLQIDGQEYMAFIDPDKADLFFRTLAFHQTGAPKEVRLYKMPQSVEQALDKTRLALHEALTQAAKKKGQTP